MIEIKHEDETFWCVVFLTDNHPTHPDFYIVDQSQRCLDNDIFPDGPMGEDSGINKHWYKGKPPGVYRLELRPWSYGPDREGEYDCGVDAKDTICLYEYKGKSVNV